MVDTIRGILDQKTGTKNALEKIGVFDIEMFRMGREGKLQSYSH